MKKQEKIFMVVLGFLGLTLFAFPMTASAAATYYVSPTGDNTTGNGSLGAPWRTIQYAVNSASPGDTIKVMDDNFEFIDDYTENITVNKSLTIERYDNSGANPQVRASSTSNHVFTVTADNVTIRGLDIYGATGSYKAGILLSGRTGCTIENNRCGWDDSHNNYYGIYLDFSSGNTLTSNNASSNYNGIWLSSSSNNTITGNTASNNDHFGIYLWFSSNNNTISGNTFSSNTCDGIVLSSSSDNTISGNTFSSNSRGIVLSSSSDNTVARNTCNSNNYYYGIYLQSSRNNTVTGNTCNSNTNYGIALNNSSANTLSDNTCSSNNGHGIYLLASGNNTISGNIFSSNTDYGIYLDYSSGNTVSGNTCSSNGDYGIYLHESSNNTLYLNNLSNNATANAYVSGGSGNIWNSPTTIYYDYTSGSFHKNYLGNYYDDYGGSDSEGDGIGEGFYSGINMTDNYPLMTTSDNYSLQAWWLHSDSIMYRDDRTKSPGSITLTGSGSHIWVADQPALTDISFSGDDSWTGQLVFTFAPASGHTFTVEMGFTTDGTDFTAGGPDATITGNSSTRVFTYETDASAFTVVTGQYLALKITNNSVSGYYNVQTGGAWSYCSSPESSTDYIVHTEPIAGSDVTKLFKNYPNPVTSTTTIEYQLKGNVMEQDAIINIYNIRGQLVKTVEGKGGVAILDVSDLANGIYFYQLKTDTFNEVKKMIILR